jgi:hypothetical protein
MKIPSSSREIPQALMQQLGTQNETDQVATFFKHIKIKKEKFNDVDALSVLLTFYTLISNEDIGEAPAKITYNRTNYFAPDDLLDIPLKFLIELINIDVNYETNEFLYALTALIYRKDWTKPFSKKEYFEMQPIFYDAPFIFSLWSAKLFNQIIVTLQENYPILYKGEQGAEESDGRKLYGLLKLLANDDATKMEKAEQMPIWRAFTWIEQTKINEINQKNADVNQTNHRKH